MNGETIWKIEILHNNYDIRKIWKIVALCPWHSLQFNVQYSTEKMHWTFPEFSFSFVDKKNSKKFARKLFSDTHQQIKWLNKSVSTDLWNKLYFHSNRNKLSEEKKIEEEEEKEGEMTVKFTIWISFILIFIKW